MSHAERVIPLDPIHDNARVKKYVRKKIRIPGLYPTRKNCSQYPDELVVQVILEYHDPLVTTSYMRLAAIHNLTMPLVRDWCQGTTRRNCWLKAMMIIEERAAKERSRNEVRGGNRPRSR